jgi:AraC-like DNA-binding protein
MLSHRIRPVSEILAPHVEHLWMVRGHLPTRWRNMILPDGAMELMINLGDPQKLCAPDNPAKHTIFRQSWISGERTTPIVIDEIGYVHLVGVRLRAGGAWPFLGIPLREFTDQVVELETIMGREIEDLRDALCEARDDDSRFDLLESWLVRRARSRTQPTRSVSYALRVIHGGLDAVRIGRIADTIGISHKHLLREFDRCVGLTPKLFARLCAFQRVIRSVGQKAEVDWAGTAATCGYHDQAHLIHEFRAFSGLTPAAYLMKRGPFLNYLEVE